MVGINIEKMFKNLRLVISFSHISLNIINLAPGVAFLWSSWVRLAVAKHALFGTCVAYSLGLVDLKTCC